MRRLGRPCALLALLGAVAAPSCGSDREPNPVTLPPSQDASVEESAAPDVAAEAVVEAAEDAGPASPIQGLGAPVTVVVDKNGIKHIQCKTDEDCYAALGWVHARDRFFFMDVIRNYMLGHTADLPFEYPGLLTEVMQYRHFMTTRDGRPLEEVVWEKLSPSTRAMMEAYVRGVNAWIAELRAGKPGVQVAEELALLDPDYASKVKDWQPTDPVAMFLGEAQAETASLNRDLTNATYKAKLPAALFQDFLFTPSAIDEPIVPTSSPKSWIKSGAEAHGIALEKVGLRGKPWQGLHESAERYAHALSHAARRMGRSNASNNWAVSSALMEPGSPGMSLLANDPHGPIQFPAGMYPVEIDSKTHGTGTLHVTGDCAPGYPFFQLGHTDSVAWGLTTSLVDGVDYYDEELSDDGKSVIFQGQPVALLEKTWELKTASGTTLSSTLRWVPHHGPVVSYDAAAKKAVSARWIGHEGPMDADGMFELMRAADIQQALAAVRKVTGLGNNFALADSQGHVAWRPAALIPKRSWAAEHPPYLPVPGDGSAEWEGFLGAGEHPELLDPAQGWVGTANNEFLGAWYDGDPTNEGQYMQDRPYNGFRARRIRELLEQDAAHHTRVTMSRMQHDTMLWYAAKLLPAVMADAQARFGDLDEHGKRLFQSLQGWQYTCPTGLDGTEPTSPASPDAALASESIGCTSFHVAGTDLSEALARPWFEAAGYKITGGTVSTGLLYVAILEPGRLMHGEGVWDNPSTTAVESRADRVVEAFNLAGARLAKNLGTDTDQWRWGRAIALRPTPALMATVTIQELGPFSTAGGMESVGTLFAIPIDEKDTGTWTAGMIRKVDVLAAEESEYWIEFPGGTEAYPASPFFKNLLPAYLEQKPSRVAFTDKQLAPDKGGSFMLIPAE